MKQSSVKEHGFSLSNCFASVMRWLLMTDNWTAECLPAWFYMEIWVTSPWQWGHISFNRSKPETWMCVNIKAYLHMLITDYFLACFTKNKARARCTIHFHHSRLLTIITGVWHSVKNTVYSWIQSKELHFTVSKQDTWIVQPSYNKVFTTPADFSCRLLQSRTLPCQRWVYTICSL